MSDTKIKEHTLINTDIKEPNHYEVIMHNDDFTPMEFVVNVLKDVFHKDNAAAQELMLYVHQHGAATVGSYTYDIAKTKVDQCTVLARAKKYPLRVTLHQV